MLLLVFIGVIYSLKIQYALNQAHKVSVCQYLFFNKNNNKALYLVKTICWCASLYCKVILGGIEENFYLCTSWFQVNLLENTELP